MSLEGKVVLVTGGTGALGSVVAHRMVREKASVAISVRPPGVHPKGSAIVPFDADVTQEQDVKKLFDAVVRKFGRVDIVVNTVGGFVGSKHLADVTVAEWDLMMTNNLKTAFLCTREALRRMKGQSFGRIINISAMTGIVPTPGRAPYAISKAGVSLMTDIAGREYKGSGITINAIAPSIIATDANKASMPDEDHTKWVAPENIAAIICYLCSEAAGSVTGTTIRASGGL